MSNLYKSGFVSFSEQNMLVIDANKNRVIRQIEEQRQEQEAETPEGEDGVEADKNTDGFHNLEVEYIEYSDARADVKINENYDVLYIKWRINKKN